MLLLVVMMTSSINYSKIFVITLLLLLSVEQKAGLTCYECDSTDLSCLFQLWSVETKECAANVTHCYTEFVHNDAESTQLKRGCGKPESCAYEGSQLCASCDTDECNTHNICHYINCGADEVDCRSANFRLTGTRREVCHENVECITKVDTIKREIQRRCATTADVKGCSDAGVKCATCNTPYCNTEKYVRCLSSTAADEQYCYGKSCFESIDNSTGAILRGCYPLKEELKTKDYKTCTSDDCNNDLIIFM